MSNRPKSPIPQTSPPRIDETPKPSSSVKKPQAIDGYLARIVKVEDEIDEIKDLINQNVDIAYDNGLKHVARMDRIEERVTELEVDDTASEATVENNPQSRTPDDFNESDDSDDDDDFYGPNRRIRVLPQTRPRRQQLKY